MKVRCLACREYVEKDTAYSRNGLSFLCSPECASELRSQKKVPARQCAHCAEKFVIRYPSGAGRRFCSRECANAGRRQGVVIVCEHCGAEKYLRPSQSQARFCSQRCAGRWSKSQDRLRVPSADNRGYRNGRYKTGKYVGKNITKKGVRLAVIERDGDFCLLCGQPPKGLHLHRVVYGSQGGKYEVENCVQVCLLHHQLVHSSKRLWMPLLLTYIERRHILDRDVCWRSFRENALVTMAKQRALHDSDWGATLGNLNLQGEIQTVDLSQYRLKVIDWDLGKRLYEDGFSTTEVGRQLGCDASMVSRKLRSLGVPMRAFGGQTGRLKLDNEEILRLFHKGLRPDAIGQVLGCTGTPIRQRLKEMGIPSFPPGHP